MITPKDSKVAMLGLVKMCISADHDKTKVQQTDVGYGLQW
jgi:hypothetical protein